jgi:hypothetical protein
MTNNAASELTLQAVPSWMPAFLVAPMIGGLSLADLIALVVLLLFVLNFVMIEIWMERKVAGHVQLRRGPLHVGPHGSLQSPADVLKPRKTSLPSQLIQSSSQWLPTSSSCPSS